MSEHGAITFSPKGYILNTENQELLEQCHKQAELEPEQLLKLAKFYRDYPTTVALGDHLALVALSNSNHDRLFQNQALSSYLSWFDIAEDVAERINPYTENSREDNADGGNQLFSTRKIAQDQIKLSIRIVPIAGIGLLVETLTGQEDGKDLSYSFVIGVAPSISR